MGWPDLPTNAWHRGTESDIGSRKTIEHGRWLIEHLPSMGVTVKANSRIARSLEIITAVQAKSIAGATESEIMEAQRTINEFFFICKTLLSFSRVYNAAAREKLQSSTDGNIDGGNDRNNAARNSQAELFHFCVMLHAGFAPVFAEPDIRFCFAGEIFGCAVKRMNSISPRKLEARFKEGIKQIIRSGLRGFVCIDIECRLAPIHEPTDLSVANDRGRHFDDAITPLFALHRSRYGGSACCGSFVIGVTRSDRNVPGPVHVAAYYQKIVLFPDTFAEPDLVDVFQSQLRRGYRAFMDLGTT